MRDELWRFIENRKIFRLFLLHWGAGGSKGEGPMSIDQRSGDIAMARKASARGKTAKPKSSTPKESYCVFVWRRGDWQLSTPCPSGKHCKKPPKPNPPPVDGTEYHRRCKSK